VRRQKLEVADIFHRHGAAWRRANAGHVSLGQLQVMSAIENCRSAVLGGHVERCEDCGHHRIAYNSCRNRHCPKCQGTAAKEWLAARAADLLPVGYFHLVFTLPAEIGAIGYQNKAMVYDLLFRAAAETLLTIAADPRHLGARIGATVVLHTWGSAMTHHPHVHMIVPGGGISLDGSRWISCRPGFLLPVRVLSRLFRRLFLAGLTDAHAAGRLVFFGDLASLRDQTAFAAHLAPLRKKDWFVYAKPPFAGPEAVLAYLARYTHRVAISNSRLVALDESGVSFRYKDYRRGGQARYRTMSLAPDEFIRRFLQHVLPKGFHRIRHYGLLASATCKATIARARELIVAAGPVVDPSTECGNTDPPATGARTDHHPPCPCCGGRMIIVEFFERGGSPRGPPPAGPSAGIAAP
jgi:Putative transposase/Transposase zinc-binding domain